MPGLKRPARKSVAVFGTTDRDLAKRNLAKFKDEQQQVDHSKGKTTLAELCDQYLATVQHQKRKTVERKTLIVRRIKSDWPAGALTQISKIKPSDVRLWLARYKLAGKCAEECGKLAKMKRAA